MPRIGKIGLEEFDSLIQKRLGARDGSIIVPPMPGIDAGVIDLGAGKVLVVAEDPIFSIPNQPLEMFGWYTVHIGASDVAVMGARPRYMTYTLLVPPGTTDADVERIVESIHLAALELGIAIVGGHTGYYPGIATPLIGGVAVFGIADRDRYITPAGAKPGDDVILTKGPAIETAGILSSLREKELVKKYDPLLIEKAKALGKQMSVVKDAMVAMEVGGVTSMHDATEGGVIGGFFEVANASGVGMEIDESLFVYPEEVRIVCEAFDIDPAKAIAEGSLIITARPVSSAKIVQKLKESGIESSIVGKVTSSTDRRTMRRISGEVVLLEVPCQDPFWPAFFRGLK
ncbi:MAG: AIR synthase [Euryarchaeota archaeon]|nr:AIR synthase [Euryarchaeota archaeon]